MGGFQIWNNNASRISRIYLGLSASHGLLSFSYSHCKRCPAHVTVNPTAVTQRGESLARHRNCNLTQYFSHLQGALKVYICANGCCVSSLLPHSTSICLTVTSCGLLGNGVSRLNAFMTVCVDFFSLFFLYFMLKWRRWKPSSTGNCSRVQPRLWCIWLHDH